MLVRSCGVVWGIIMEHGDVRDDRGLVSGLDGAYTDVILTDLTGRCYLTTSGFLSVKSRIYEVPLL